MYSKCVTGADCQHSKRGIELYTIRLSGINLQIYKYVYCILLYLK